MSEKDPKATLPLKGKGRLNIKVTDELAGYSSPVVTVNLLGVPAVSIKAFHGVFGVSQVGATLDRDVVVIIQIDDFAQLHMSGQRGCLVRNTFHQVAVADDGVGVVVNNFMLGTIEGGG